jgi:HAMP domain-containing protein
MSMRIPIMKGGANSKSAYLIDSTGWMRAWVLKLRWWVLTMVLMFVPLMMAQNRMPPTVGRKAQPQPANQPGMLPPMVLVPSASEEPVALQRTRAARNAMRQKKLFEKMQQLERLTDELSAAVGETENGTLSMDVLKKSEEIEKLAKSIHSLLVTPL